jgi:hypothetical protein
MQPSIISSKKTAIRGSALRSRYSRRNLGISHLFQEHERKHDPPANLQPRHFGVSAQSPLGKPKCHLSAKRTLAAAASPFPASRVFYTLTGSSAPKNEPPSQSGLNSHFSFVVRGTSFNKLSATQYNLAGTELQLPGQNMR